MSVRPLGFIEGFYGPQWSWDERRQVLDWLAATGLNTYIYAPKGDAVLRSGWRGHWDVASEEQLHQLRVTASRRDVALGVGLSPLGLVEDMGAADRRLLRAKVDRLNALHLDVLCILFDDMRGDIATLPDRQLALVDDIVSRSSAQRHIICPTYYSSDPVLETVFGKMPTGYLTHLGEYLDSSIDVFWCGDKVIAPDIPADSLDHLIQVLRRKPVIWDNYFANDGRQTSDFIPIKQLSGRSADLAGVTSGHLLNPMNQSAIACAVGAQLADLYQGLSAGDEGYLDKARLPAELAQGIMRHRRLFAEKGRTILNRRDIDMLDDFYRRFDHPVAVEIIRWLNGDYIFDPACLTG